MFLLLLLLYFCIDFIDLLPSQTIYTKRTVITKNNIKYKKTLNIYVECRIYRM